MIQRANRDMQVTPDSLFDRDELESMTPEDVDRALSDLPDSPEAEARRRLLEEAKQRFERHMRETRGPDGRE